MNKHSEVLHHYHTRKRIYKEYEPYPHPIKWKGLIDKIIYPIGILGPILTIPQLLEVWISKNGSGISIFTWTSWILTAIFWLAYGIIHKEKPIIFSYIGWILIDLGVVIGAILYG